MTASASPAPLAPQVQQQLEQLRDIRLPAEISWWPPAPGWWLALGLLAVIIAGAAIFAARRRRTVKYAALRELERLCAAGPGSLGELATEVGILLRRVALRRGHGEHLAQASGEAWQSFLSAAPHGLPEQVARLIANAAYAPTVEFDGARQLGIPGRNELLEAAATWIRRHA